MADFPTYPPLDPGNVPAPLSPVVPLNPPMVGDASPFDHVDGQNRDLILEAIRAWARGPLRDWSGNWQQSLADWLGVTVEWLNQFILEVIEYIEENAIQGPPGPPGPNTVPTDLAVAALFAPGSPSATLAAASQVLADKPDLTYIERAVARGLAPYPMIGYGHSYIAGGYSGGPAASGLWPAMLAAQLAVAYTNRGVGGARVEETAWKLWASDATGFTIGSKATVVIQSLLNTLRAFGIDDPSLKGANYALRTMAAVVSAKSVISVADSTRFTFSGTGWGAISSSTAYPAGNFRATVAGGGIGATVEFTTQTEPRATQLLTLGRKVGLAAGRMEIRRLDTDAVILDWANVNLAPPDINQNYVPVAFSLDVPKGTPIRVTNLDPGSGASTTTIVGLLERETVTPNPVLFMKEPYLANWAASVTYPNGSDAACDAFNDLLDTIAAERPNLYVATPSPFWTKANAAGEVLADQVHPNVEGNTDLRDGALLGFLTAAGKAAALPQLPETDSGLVVLDSYLAGGITGNLRGRRIGDRVTITGNITGGTIANRAETVLTTALPLMWRPPLIATTGAATFGGANTDPGAVRYPTTGIISAVQGSGGTKSQCYFTISFMVA